MDQSETDPQQESNHNEGTVTSGTVSVELEKVRKALSIKVEKHGSHYSDVALIGEGSYGEVHGARDVLLGREVAIKSLKERFRDNDIIVDRFLKEARGTAQLEHPNIMPVHEMGVENEFGIYFTMKKIEGEDLKEILVKLQTNTAFYEKTYPLNYLLEIFLAVCNGVAFAHSKGVIHRDLKPANIMVGEYGEVLILDWGLVKQVGTEEESGNQVQLNMDDADAGMMTLDGAISGTPNYMAPEQADGRIKDVDFQSDVYGLGAILYHILTYNPPFERAQIRQLLENVKNGSFIPPRKRFPERKIPRELEAICLKAMSRHPVNRYRSVEDLAQDVRNYIANFDVRAYKAPRWVRFWKTCKRNPVKSSVIAATVAALVMAFGVQRAMLYGTYTSNMERAAELHHEGSAAIDEATALYDELQTLYAASKLKKETPRKTELKRLFEEKRTAAVALYNVEVGLYESIPGPYKKKPAVHQGYIRVMGRRVDFELHCRQYNAARRAFETVRLRSTQPDVQLSAEGIQRLEAIQRRVDGQGRLEITGPEDVHDVIVWLLADSEVDPRRRLSGDAIKRGKLPMHLDNIKKGSYVLQVTIGTGEMIPYPVFIDHGEQKQLVLETPDTIPAGMVYIPGGDFIFGGEDSRFYREHRLSLPAFYIRKHEVTVVEYLEFWQSLSVPALKSEYMSRIRFREQERRYTDAWDGQGNLLDGLSLEYPVVGISRKAAEAFCEWKSRQTDTIIRLPTAAEWEKAARGVDGRRYVWGNRYDQDANLALTMTNAKGKERYPLWAPPGKFSRDISIYNVYDMAGNVREMTLTPLPYSDTLYQLKGGSASTPPNFLPCSNASDTPVIPSDVGFRYMQEIPEK